MDEATLLRFATIFVPELKPLVPDIVAATVAAEKVAAVIGPVVQSGSLGIFSLLPALRQIEPMAPELEKAAKTAEAVDAILVKYESRLAAAAKP
jgi:hypothetical protein